MLQQVYLLIDRVIVGQFVGDTAFSAIGATNAPSQMFMSMCIGAAVGAGVVTAQYHGAGNEDDTASAIRNGFIACGGLVLVATVVALFFTKPILVLLNTPEILMDDALTYMYIYMGGMIAVAAYWTPFNVLRSLGDARTPLIFLLVCSVLNIILDLIFVIPLGMGVAGAAAATVISQAVSAVLCMIYAVRNVPQVRKAFRIIPADKELVLKNLKVGVPTGLQYALIYVSSIILQRIVNGFGEDVIGAFTATTQIELLVQQVFVAIGQAMVAYTGQNIGAGKLERISDGVQASMKISAALSVIILAVLWVFGYPIMGIFVKNTKIVSIAASGIRVTSLFLFALGGVQILRFMLNGAGDSNYALLNGAIEVVARIGFAFALTAIPFIGMWGIWLTTGLTWTVTAVFAFLRYRKGAWKMKSLVGGTS